MSFARSTWAVLAKDAATEFRTRYALSSILLFALVSIAAVSFALKGQTLTERQAAALAWIIVFFAAMAGLARPFVQEAESGTEMLLKQVAPPEAVWLGKLLFNLGLMAGLEVFIFPVYSALMDAPIVQPLRMLWVAALGALALSGASTIVAAMVAKARSRSSVFAVAALPLLLPVLIFLVEASAPAFGARDPAGSANPAAIATVSYTGILMVMSWLLFPLVWEE